MQYAPWGVRVHEPAKSKNTAKDTAHSDRFTARVGAQVAWVRCRTR